MRSTQLLLSFLFLCISAWHVESAKQSVLKSVKLGAVGCASNSQCAAGWPGATCQRQSGPTKMDGTCNCPAPEYIMKKTRDGSVCTKLTDANGAPTPVACPLPENGGSLTVLTNDQQLVFCNPEAKKATPTTGLCAYKNSTTGAIVDVSSLYNCIEADASLVAMGINGFCCPNRGHTRSETTDKKCDLHNCYSHFSSCASVHGLLSRQAQAGLKSVQLGAVGCGSNSQCASGWPGATCQGQSGPTKMDGTCYCPQPDYIIRTTSDGNVCIKLTDAMGNFAMLACPLPENGGFLTMLMNDGKPVFCNPSATKAAPTTGLCAYKNSKTGAIVDVSSLYNCIQAGADLAMAGINGFCCPNRANTCVQPKMTVLTGGSTTAETRYWYNATTGKCEAFLWDAYTQTANPTSPNNFRTIDQCQSYCANILKKA